MQAMLNKGDGGACSNNAFLMSAQEYEDVDSAYQTKLDVEQKDSREAIHALGVMWAKNDVEIPYHFYQAEHFLCKAARHGFSPATYEFGVLCYNYGLEKTAIDYFEQADNQGILRAALMLGYLYCEDKQAGQDDPEAMKYFKNRSAQDILQTDLQNRTRLLEQAKELGMKRGQSGIVTTTELITRSNSKAIAYFKKADEQGVPRAAFMLGEMHKNGWGVACDVKRALEYFKRAEGYPPI